jgi:hypothetical protein
MYSTLWWCRRRDSVFVLPRRNLFFCGRRHSDLFGIAPPQSGFYRRRESI